MKYILLAVVSMIIVLAGCGTTAQESPSSLSNISQSTIAPVENGTSSTAAPTPESFIPNSSSDTSTSPVPESPTTMTSTTFPNALPLGSRYVEEIADALLEQIITSNMGDVERLRAVYDYLIANTYFADPVGLDVWQWRGNEQQPPSYLETRAISPILYGIGTCEDYAAAMAVLAMRMGYPAEYVFGMTVSVTGQYVDHAWTVVQVKDQWYHLDPQLEDNVTRGDRVQNRYFMRCDKVMLLDHRWGENLIEYRRDLPNSTKEYIRNELTPPVCNGELIPSPPYTLTQAPKPNRNAILAQLEKDKARYERDNGPLPKMELNIAPPLEINP